jgi:Asp/Glu/hydantoin racemase
MTNYLEKKTIRGGKNFYGQPIGILMLDYRVPRLPGDIGNAYTFDFPVRYKVVSGASAKKIILTEDPTEMLVPYIKAAQELEAEGVRAITTSCGYLAHFQKQMADAVNVPVFTSSLMQLPMVSRMIRSDQKVGIITADSRTLTEEHLRSAGIENIPVVIKGSQDTPAFYNVFPTGGEVLDYPACRDGVVEMVRSLKEEHPEVGAIVCEGTNFALFRSDVQEATGLPFFDIVTLTRMMYQAVTPIGLPTGCM